MWFLLDISTHITKLVLVVTLQLVLLPLVRGGYYSQRL